MNIHGYKKKKKNITRSIADIQNRVVEKIRQRDKLVDNKRYNEATVITQEIETLDDRITSFEGANNRIASKIDSIHAKKEDKIFLRKQWIKDRPSGKKVK